MIKSGIYFIKCLSTDKYYIGQTNNIDKRLCGHRSDLKCGRHHNILLQRAYDKYGKDAFEFGVLKRCLISELDTNEREFIDIFNSMINGFNIENGGNANKTLSDESKLKMSIAKKGKPSPLKGTKMTDAARLNISISHKGLPSSRKGVKCGTSWNKGLKNVQVSTQRKAVVVSDRYSNDVFGIFPSINHFREKYNVKSKNVTNKTDKSFNIGRYNFYYHEKSPHF